jgi:hypothetical protein
MINEYLSLNIQIRIAEVDFWQRCRQRSPYVSTEGTRAPRFVAAHQISHQWISSYFGLSDQPSLVPLPVHYGGNKPRGIHIFVRKEIYQQHDLSTTTEAFPPGNNRTHQRNVWPSHQFPIAFKSVHHWGRSQADVEHVFHESYSAYLARGGEALKRRIQDARMFGEEVVAEITEENAVIAETFGAIKHATEKATQAGTFDPNYDRCKAGKERKKQETQWTTTQ